MKPKNRKAWTCSICGKQLTNAGRIGHMRWKHGKDHLAPLISVEKPMPVGEARRKAKAYLFTVELLRKYGHERLVDKLEAIAEVSPSHDALVASLGEEISHYARMKKEPIEEVTRRVMEVKKARQRQE